MAIRRRLPLALAALAVLPLPWLASPPSASRPAVLGLSSRRRSRTNRRAPRAAVALHDPAARPAPGPALPPPVGRERRIRAAIYLHP